MKSLGFKKISVGIAQLRRMSREERQSALYTLQLLFASLNFLSVSANMLYVIKGAIILAACVIDMRKHINKRQCAVCTKKEPFDWE